MADLPISGLPAVATPAATDEFATAQGGVTKKYTGSQISDAALTFTSLTQHSIPYVGASGVITENNTSLTWTQGTKTLNAVGIVNVNTAVTEASAVLQVSSTIQGFLPPVMTTAQRDAIATPAEGLVVYDTDEETISYRSSTAWEHIPSIISESQSNTISGPWAAPQTFDLEFTILDNKKVMVSWSAVSAVATVSAIATSVLAAPTTYRPVSNQRGVITLTDNGQFMFGLIEITPAGVITLSLTATQDAFSGISTGGNTGVNAQTFTYDITT